MGVPYLGEKIMAKIDDDGIHTWMERLIEEKKTSGDLVAATQCIEVVGRSSTVSGRKHLIWTIL